MLKKKINVVFPLSEWELESLAEEKNFIKKKVEIIISNLTIIKTCKNKILMAKKLLQNNFLSPEIFKFSEIHKKLPVIKKKFMVVEVNSSHLFFKKWQLPKKIQKNFFSKIFKK